jgi:Na+(H+)/acetate symporter ActP
MSVARGYCAVTLVTATRMRHFSKFQIAKMRSRAQLSPHIVKETVPG